MNNPMISILNDMHEFTESHNMKINSDTSKLMVFNPSKKYQFPPEIKFEGHEQLEYARQSKILGVIVTDNLKWSENTKYITQKAMSNIWTSRRMMKLGLDEAIVFDVYTKEIRTLLEFGVQVWKGGLTEEDSDKIERVQKVV